MTYHERVLNDLAASLERAKRDFTVCSEADGKAFTRRSKKRSATLAALKAYINYGYSTRK